MADVNDLYFVGDDFEAVLAILEDEEELEEHFSEAVDSVQHDDCIICEFCQKKCKSKAGSKRHKTCKHKDKQQDQLNGEVGEPNDFTVHEFTSISKKARAKILESKVYPQSVREELRSYTFDLIDSSNEFLEIQKLCKCLIKSGNAEKFYSNFYGSVVLHSPKIYDGLSHHAATLLSMKVADCILAQTKEKGETNTPDHIPAKWSDKETAGLQYIGGYVLHKLYNKHIKINSEQSEQTASILKAGKEGNETDIESQKLTSSLDRGALWAISKTAQLIFERIEHHFRIVTSKSLHKINISLIESRSVCDTQLVSAYNEMVSNSDLTVDNSIAKDVLHNIVNLYVRVRCFSFAKDIIQKHKIKSKQMKAKALRKEISRASKELEIDRQL